MWRENVFYKVVVNTKERSRRMQQKVFLVVGEPMYFFFLFLFSPLAEKVF
jgi:hypothetical protein